MASAPQLRSRHPDTVAKVFNHPASENIDRNLVVELGRMLRRPAGIDPGATS